MFPRTFFPAPMFAPTFFPQSSASASSGVLSVTATAVVMTISAALVAVPMLSISASVVG